MIRYKASEIIHSALKLSALNNSKLFTERDFVEVLNTQYRSIYNLLTDAGDGHYTKEFVARDFGRGPEGTVVIDLPKDFYQLTFVGTYNDWNPSLAQRIDKIPSSSPGLGYKLVNKQIHISNNMEGPFLIRYVPVPKTITTPAPTLTFDPSIINKNCKYTAKWHSFWTLDENFEPPTPPEPELPEDDKIYSWGRWEGNSDGIRFYTNDAYPNNPEDYNSRFVELPLFELDNTYGIVQDIIPDENVGDWHVHPGQWFLQSYGEGHIIRLNSLAIGTDNAIIENIPYLLHFSPGADMGLIGKDTINYRAKYYSMGWFKVEDGMINAYKSAAGSGTFDKIVKSFDAEILDLFDGEIGMWKYDGYTWSFHRDYDYSTYGYIEDSSYVPPKEEWATADDTKTKALAFEALASYSNSLPKAINNDNDQYKLGLYVIDKKERIEINDDIANPGGNVWILNDVVVNKNGTFRLIQIDPKPIMVKISNLTFDDVINIAFPDGNCFLVDGTLDETEYPLADNVWKYAFGVLERRGNLLFWNELDYTEYFCGVDRTLDDYVWDVYGNFIFLQKDHRLRIWNGFEKYHHDEFADDAIPGIVDILCSTSTDDRSLYGVHINNCQLASFVPDTVLDYPNNAFYDLLIARVASQLLLIAKQDPSNAVMLAGQLETQLLKTIRRDAFNFPTVNNVYRRRSI